MFIVSGPELVIAQCQAGIIGGFPALNARPQSALSDWLKQIKESLAEYAEKNPDQPVAPYAVNQIVHASNSRLLDDMATCVEHEVPIIITSLRPPAEVVAAVRGGLLSLEEACSRYTLTVEEFLSWQQSIDEHGLAGLRTTRIQQYRQ